MHARSWSREFIEVLLIFVIFTLLIAIPSAIKVFNWLATMYKGSIRLAAPMLYALSFLFLFAIGGLTGLMQGALAVNVHIHDTYFIVDLVKKVRKSSLDAGQIDIGLG